PLQPPVGLRHHRRIFLVVRVLRPSVEHEIVVRDLARSILHANGARITQPHPIRGHMKKFHRLQRSPRLLQNRSHARFRLAVLHQQEHPLHPRQMPHNFRERPRNRRKFPRPVRQLMRPRQPRSLMPLPLRRHSPSHLHRSHPLVRLPPPPSFRAERPDFLSRAAFWRVGPRSRGIPATNFRLPPLCVLCASALSSLFLSVCPSLFSFVPSPQQRLIRINPSIPEKRPIPPRLLALPRIALHHQYLFFFLRGLRHHHPKWIRHKRISPKLQSRIALRRLPLESHTV